MSESARIWANLILILAAVFAFSALLSWIERRLLGVWQDRYGPNRVGPFGILQIVADSIKLLTKEDWVPPFADKAVFVLAPTIVAVTTLLAFAVVPIAPDIGVVDLNIGLLFFLAMSSLGVYSVVLGGWASNNKYSLLGGLSCGCADAELRGFHGSGAMGVVMLAGSFNLRDIVAAQENLWFCVPQILGLATFTVAGIAEARRLPFDLPESGERAGGWLSHRILQHEVRPVFHW